MSKGVVGLLLVVVLGLGFVIGRMLVPNASEAPAADADATSSERPSAAPVTAPAPVPAAAGIDAPTLAASGDPVTEAFRAAYARLPAPAQVRGDGVISGTVRSESGEPIAGAVVTAVARGLPNTRPAHDPRATPDPAEDLRLRAEWIASQAATRRQATSGTDGAWRLEGLADLDYGIEATAPGWALRTSAEAYHGVRPGATVDFLGRPRVPLRVDVRLEGGGVPDGATIGFRTKQRLEHREWTPSRPTLDVEPGAYVAIARTQGESPQSSDAVDLYVERGAPASVVFQLRVRPALRLRVRWPDGEWNPAPSASVHRLEGGDDSAPDDFPARALLGGRSPREGNEWLFPDLEPGRYLVAVARSRGRPIEAQAIVEVTARVTECELVVPPVDRSTFVAVHVTGPDGSPVRDVALHGIGRAEGGAWSASGEVIERTDGSKWWFPGEHLTQDGPDVRWYLRASHPTLGQRTVEVARGTEMAVEIRLLPPARVDVVVEAPDGVALPGGLNVAFADGIEVPEEQLSREGVAAVSRDGRATLRALQPGPGHLVVGDAGRFGPSAVLHRFPVSIEPGTQTVRIPLPRLHTVTFRGEPSGTVRVKRVGAAVWRRNEPLDAKGTLVLKLLPDGDYESAVGPKRSSFTLPGATEVDLR